jgi:hypothetical protein
VLAATILEHGEVDSIANVEPIVRMDSFKQRGKRRLFSFDVEGKDLTKFARPKTSSGRNT